MSKITGFRWQLRSLIKNKSLFGILATLVMVTAIPAGLYILQHYSFLPPQAANEDVAFYFSPASKDMPPDSTFLLMMDAKANNIGFVRVVVTFDNTKIQLTHDPDLNVNLKTVIQKTAYAQANQTGKLQIVVGLTPGDTPPTGTFQFASFAFGGVSSVQNDTTVLTLDSSDIQVVSMLGTNLSGSIQPAVVRLNVPLPTATSTPTLTPTVTPAPTATSGVIPTTAVTSTSTPTATPVPNSPTDTPTPVPLPTLPPEQFTSVEGNDQTAEQSSSNEIAQESSTETSAGTGSESGSSSNQESSSSGSESSSNEQSTRPADFNGDSKVNILDLSIFLSRYGKGGGNTDLNGDGQTNIMDLSILLSRWGR